MTLSNRTAEWFINTLKNCVLYILLEKQPVILCAKHRGLHVITSLLSLELKHPPRSMCWRLAPSMALLECSRNFRRCGLVGGHSIIGVCPEGTSLFLSFTSWLSCLPHASHHNFLSKSNGAKQTWTEISKTVSQNTPFLFISWLV